MTAELMKTVKNDVLKSQQVEMLMMQFCRPPEWASSGLRKALADQGAHPNQISQTRSDPMLPSCELRFDEAIIKAFIEAARPASLHLQLSAFARPRDGKAQCP
jgi:hypothetical protein